MRTLRVETQASDRFDIAVDESVIEPDVQWFLSAVRETFRQSRATEGQTMQVGWLELQVLRSPSGSFSFREPDMSGTIPVAWTQGVTNALRHLRLQTAACESLSVEPLFPLWRESAIACCESHRAGDACVLARVSPEGPDSGWFIGCGEAHDHGDPGNLVRTSLYAAACAVPAVIPLLALPAPCELALTRSAVDSIVIDGARPTIRPGSYLDLTRR